MVLLHANPISIVLPEPRARGYSRPDGGGRRRTQDVRTTRVLLRAGLGLALPDTDSGSSDGNLATGGAGVLGVLGDFHLLDAVGGK